MAALGWLLNAGFAGSPVGAAPAPAPTTAVIGRARRQARRQRFVVEIDGQYFEAASEAEALAILAQARALAERAAQAKADDIVERATPKVLQARVVKRVAIKTPKVQASQELAQAAEETRLAIERTYRSASDAAELRLLLALAAAAEADEEEFLLLH